MGYHLRDDKVTPEFGALLLRLAGAYPHVKLTRDLTRAYAWALGDIPLSDLQSAFGRAVRESKMFPSVAEIRGFVKPTTDDAGILAWAAFGRAATVAGSWVSLDVDDGAAAQALVDTFGSWPEYCAVGEGPQLALKRQEFLAAYRQARRQAPPPRHLPGQCEAQGTLPDPATATSAWHCRLLAGGEVQWERGLPALAPAETGALRLVARVDPPKDPDGD